MRDGDIAGQLRMLREAIASEPIAHDLSEALADVPNLIGPGPYAVRSSATHEDAADRSCAGQFESVLGVSVEELTDAVRSVWASMWSERAYTYLGMQAGGGAQAMAVVIQKQVVADVSGVIFTCDPVLGDSGKIVVEAVRGLGESLVSGRATPDRWVLSKEPMLITGKFLSGGVRGVDAPDGGILDDAAVVELAELGLQIERQQGCAQDIEWAIADGEIYALQARPVTAFTPAAPDDAEDRQVWTNVNTAEVMPDVMTPISWSVMEPLAEKLLGHTFKKLGIDMTGHRLLGQIAGRAYFNLNTLFACVRRIPGMSEKGITEMFGGQQEVAAVRIADEDLPKFRLSLLKVAASIPAMLVEFMTFSTGKGQLILDRVKRIADAEAAVDAAVLSPEELVSRIAASANDMASDTAAFDLFGMGKFYDMALYKNCGQWFGEEGNGLASRMLSALGSNENAQAGLDLWGLAGEAVKDNAALQPLLEAVAFEQLRNSLSRIGAGQSFLSAWDAFMQRHGHHCRGELELFNPRWAETPDYVLSMVQSYIRAMDSADGDFHSRYDALAERRDNAISEARKRLRNPMKRKSLYFLLRKAHAFAPMRESIKSEIVRRNAALRRLLLEYGERLAAQGLIAHRDDVFFLLLAELEEALQPNCDSAGLQRRVAMRRRDYAANQAVTPPPIVVGRFDVRQAQTTAGAGHTATIFEGVAVNPGVVVGKARVILRAGEDHVLPGEILVAPFTDPGWTPYFLSAAAIVMDIGGILSHGSVVAREYGIPAVVNVGNATRVIRSGQLLEVDGARGTVRILSASGDSNQKI